MCGLGDSWRGLPFIIIWQHSSKTSKNENLCGLDWGQRSAMIFFGRESHIFPNFGMPLQMPKGNEMCKNSSRLGIILCQTRKHSDIITLKTCWEVTLVSMTRFMDTCTKKTKLTTLTLMDKFNINFNFVKRQGIFNVWLLWSEVNHVTLLKKFKALVQTNLQLIYVKLRIIVCVILNSLK